jgi:hypothetical protein
VSNPTEALVVSAQVKLTHSGEPSYLAVGITPTKPTDVVVAVNGEPITFQSIELVATGQDGVRALKQVIRRLSALIETAEKGERKQCGSK